MTDNQSNVKNSPPSSFRLESVKHRRGVSILISGVVSISEFSEEMIAVKSHGMKLLIRGKRLNMTVFENNSIEISGRVEDIAFCYGKN